jgi:RNA polymerase sigma factor (sigma-70 family)
LANQPEKTKAGFEGACSDLVRRNANGEDAVQEACVRVLQMPPTDAISDPVRYVLRVARNLFIDDRRRKGREARLFEYAADAATAADDSPSPERILAGKESLAGILTAIDRLPPRCREAFVLHRFENLSYSTIAHRKGISISMVEKHVAEAMARLARVRGDLS